MTEDVKDVSEMDWSGHGRSASIDCRVVFVAQGSPHVGLAQQSLILRAATEAGFEVGGLAVKPAQTTSDYHRSHMGQSSDVQTEPPELRSGIELSVQYLGGLAEAATAAQAFANALPDSLELVRVTVGRLGDDYHGSNVVVVD